MDTTSEAPTPHPYNPAMRDSRTPVDTQTMPTHPDAVIADSCLRLAQKCDEEAQIVGLVDEHLADELTRTAHRWRAAAATHRRRTRPFAAQPPQRPSLRLVS